MEDVPFCESHCTTCFKNVCVQSDGQCSFVDCPNTCGMKMHLCKLNDHADYICPVAVVSCLNKGNGCVAMVVRRKMAEHLHVCPANVVYCSIICNIPKRKSPSPEVIHVDTTRATSQSPFVPPVSPAPSVPLLHPDIVTPVSSYSQNDAVENETETPHIVEPVLPNEFVDRPFSLLFPENGTGHICGKVIPRAYHDAHCRWHSDVLRQIDGSIELRCPLYKLGCNFVAVRLRPNDPNCRLLYNPMLNRFAIGLAADGISACRPDISHGDVVLPQSTAPAAVGLNDMPTEIVVYLSRFLDDTALVCLSQVSRRLHEVTRLAISERLIVTPKWCRLRSSLGPVGWKILKFVWSIPDRTQSITRWHITSARAELSQHLDTCPYNTRSIQDKPFSLHRGVEEDTTNIS
ncbi:hypothetical protein EG68_03854 [Paragonimus skrjabini miyazakii]|uniref:Uncharacterized protein n=1 Tax=Paragonimus skrjabini miyazakii TaxID=59628 RepID=A0A8S9YZS2_9TREM|nr:hypothetical protein EG68_03854 [Paragonimus skrjabini miyazakii]